MKLLLAVIMIVTFLHVQDDNTCVQLKQLQGKWKMEKDNKIMYEKKRSDYYYKRD